MFSESFVPVQEPGGGGWSIMQLTLRALYDEYLHFHNWWTKSNDNMPLVKYLGCKFKFYRSAYIDYIVIPQLCPPFAVTRDDYLSMQPSRMLLNRQRFIVPRLDRKNYKRNYISKRFKPPSLFQTKWYFQQDITQIPFIVLKVAATSLDQFYQPENQISYNITLYTLSTFFENPAFEYEPNTGYSPKTAGTQKFFLWGLENGTHQPSTYKDVIALALTTKYQKGSLFTTKNDPSKWGNPFHAGYTHPDARVWYSTKNPTTTDPTTNFDGTLLHSIFDECRYNPFKDNGVGNTVYFKSTSLPQGTFPTQPNKDDIVINNLPLWLIAYSWTSWLKKLKPINHIDTEYIMVVKSNFIVPQRQWYVFLDWYFVHPITEKLTETERANWHPQYNFQTESEFYLAQSGPGAPKINRSKCIQANCNYKFFLKWGGCPPGMEDITNPADQEKFPIPRNILEGPQITSPEKSKQACLYSWDQRYDTITQKAAERIQKYLSPPKCFTDSGTLNVPAKKETPEKDEPTSDEETQTLPEQITQLKLQQQLLKQRILRLTRKRKLFP